MKDKVEWISKWVCFLICSLICLLALFTGGWAVGKAFDLFGCIGNPYNATAISAIILVIVGIHTGKLFFGFGEHIEGESWFNCMIVIASIGFISSNLAILSLSNSLEFRLSIALAVVNFFLMLFLRFDVYSVEIGAYFSIKEAIVGEVIVYLLLYCQLFGYIDVITPIKNLIS